MRSRYSPEAPSVLSLSRLASSSAWMRPVVGAEMPGHIFLGQNLETEGLGAFAIEPGRAQAVQLQAVVDRLQHAVGNVVRLHRIGEDEVAARLRDPPDLLQHLVALGGMKDRVLTSDHVVAG